MSKKMLIDAAHPEETRVVVVNGNRIEEFDFEAAAKKPLKGNIYLAKVTRVEPSLQAAFVNFGGNRHGFLAFNEIHPDYYQIPVADRQRLIAQQEAAKISQPDEESEAPEISAAESEAPAEELESEAPGATDGAEPAAEDADETEAQAAAPADEAAAPEVPEGPRGEVLEVQTETAPPTQTGGAADDDDLDDALEEARHRRFQPQGRPYKIHEVVKRHQIMLVQVVKEERGTKGAALTTYLSLAGRYCVLMPNTARGGGISRKITNQADRKRLKSAVNELDIPQGIGLIIRTAGAHRTKAEIKRDYEYLIRVWENVRELTLKSTAPALVYEEGNLIKRAIRDLYSKDIDTIQVDGDEGYKDAKAFMRTLMPSHAKAVQQYKDRIPLFQRHQIESLLDQMFQPTVHLRSGGYIVINQTEALVSIDVNSGRSTREHSIEETALRTNLEAADEAARQLRLRDLAGLIVIDFIDMEEGRNNRSVEKRLKDALKSDRARIQVGRISTFGLLEMSRQRLRAGVVEGSTHRCPHCEGSGIVRSVESAALRALRALEEEGLRDRTALMTLKLPPNVALYILNHKRADIMELEQRYGTSCVVEADDTLPASGLVLDRTQAKEPGQAPRLPQPAQAVRFETAVEIDEDEEEAAEPEEEIEAEADEEEAPRAASAEDDGEERGGKRKRRRRRRGRRGDEPRGEGRSEGRAEGRGEGRDESRAESRSEPHSAEAAGEREARFDGEELEDGEEGAERPRSAGELNGANGAERGGKRRRRGRRGGRRNRERGDEQDRPRAAPGAAPARESHAEFETAEPRAYPAPAPSLPDPFTAEPAPTTALPAERPSFPLAAETFSEERAAPAPAEAASPPPEPYRPEPFAPQPAEPAARPDEPPETSDGPPRRGWWQRRFGGG
jgi:ribonuclease E